MEITRLQMNESEIAKKATDDSHKAAEREEGEIM